VDRELDTLCRRAPQEVILPSRLQPLLPTIEVYARQLAERRALQVQFQALALAEEGTAVRREVQRFLRGNLPDGPVDRLDVVAGRVWWGCFRHSHYVR